MKKIDLGQTIQVLANVGVIAGLVFVGLQLRQDREFAALDAVNRAQDSRIEWAALLSEGDNAQVWSRGISGDESLSPAELARFEALSLAFEMTSFTVFNNARNLDGLVPPSRVLLGTAAVYAKYPALWEARQQRGAEEIENRVKVGDDFPFDGWNLEELVERLRQQ